jgi:hypothetical protein
MQLIVESYSGYKANERPVKFWVGDKPVFVESIEDQWRGIDAMYFRVRADDRNTYVLKYNESTDLWTLEKSPDRRQPSGTSERIE